MTAHSDEHWTHEQCLERLASRSRLDIQKKSAHALEQGRPDILNRRRDWFDGQLDLDPAKLVFIDESVLQRHGRSSV